MRTSVPVVDKIRRIFLCALIPALFAVPQAFGQTKDDDIMKLFRVSGTAEIMNQAMEQMFMQLGPMPPAVKNFLTQKLSSGEFIRLFVPVYNKHFTHDEIKQMIAFYESPVGRKMVQTTPVMMKEMMPITMQWANGLTEEIMKLMR